MLLQRGRRDAHHRGRLKASMETLALIFTVISATATATWVLHAKLSSIELALREHVANDQAEFTKIHNLIRLEGRRKKASK